MSFWWWVLLFGAIAVAALVVIALLGLRLWRKSKVLLAELGRLSASMAALEAATGGVGPAGGDAWVPEPVNIRGRRGSSTA